MSMFTFAIAATALVASTHALPLDMVTGAGRGLLDNQGTCNPPEEAIGNGCVYLTDCTDCGTGSKCVANYELDGLEAYMESPEMELANNEMMVCAMLAGLASPRETPTGGARKMLDMEEEGPDCPNDAAIDGIDEPMWTGFVSQIEETGIAVTDAATAKTFIAAKCSTVEHIGCISTSMKPMMEAVHAAMELDACAGWSGVREGTTCRLDGYAVNSTCFLPFIGAQFGVEEAGVMGLHETITELHTACQSKTTEAACHAFNGSAMLTAITETTVADLTVAAAAVATASAQDGLVGYGFAAMMAAVMALL